MLYAHVELFWTFFHNNHNMTNIILFFKCMISSLSFYLTPAGIACERCIGIFLPLHYSRLVTLYRVRVSLLLCITTPLAVLIPSIVFGNRWHKDLPCIFFIVMPPWLCCLICGWLLFCIVSMLTIYICILRTSVRLQKQVNSTESSVNRIILTNVDKLSQHRD